MKQELDDMLCKKYPLILADRNKDPTVTLMCWGFECSDGWYTILDALMDNIQHHIDWKTRQRNANIAFNQSIIDARRHPANWTKFNELHKADNQYTQELREQIKNGTLQFRDVEPEVTQVVLIQVKEKFGTLRFYYSGGDDYISGLVAMAESMSGHTCEECGSPGEIRRGGWIKTLCDKHEDERQQKMKERFSHE
jgi:hypothetical protein